MKKLFSLAFMAMLVPFAVNAETTTCDDATSGYIQCLIDSSDGTVTIPEGEYISSQITIDEDMEIIGEGDVTITSTDGKNLINITGAVTVSIENIELVNLASATADAFAIYASVDTVSLTVDGLTTSGFSVGILVKGADKVTITNSDIDVTTIDAEWSAIGIQLDAVTEAVVEDNSITTDLEGVTTGIHIQTGTSVTVTGNTIDSSTGIYVYDQENLGTEISNATTAVESNDFSENCNGEITVFLPTVDGYLYVGQLNEYGWYSYSYTENGIFYQVTDTDNITSTLAYNSDTTNLFVMAGEYEITDGVTFSVKTDTTVVVDEGAIITVDEISTFEINGTLVNNGTIIVNEASKLKLNGTLVNDGAIIVNGEIITTGADFSYSGDGSITTVSASDVAITDSKDSDVVYEIANSFADVIANTLANKSSYAAFVLGKESVSVEVTVVEVDAESTDADVAAAIAAMTEATEGTVVSFFDISLLLSDETESMNITELDEAITMTIAMPEGLDALEDGYEREFYILRYHNGKVISVEGVVSEDGTTISFETDSFSNYSLTFIDSEVTADSSVENPSTGDAIVTAAIVGGISLIALVGVSLKFKKN